MPFQGLYANSAPRSKHINGNVHWILALATTISLTEVLDVKIRETSFKSLITIKQENVHQKAKVTLSVLVRMFQFTVKSVLR